jgi:tetratricopeptide (TPR) repeat protein
MTFRFFSTATLALGLSLSIVALDAVMPAVGFVQQASAQSNSGEKKQRETRRTPALRNKVYEKLAEAQAFAEAKDYAAAQQVLDGMIAGEGKRALNSYELANVYNLYAFLRYSVEDYRGALKNYDLVIRQPDIPLAMEINTRFTVAQLYFVQEQWQQGVDALLQWFEMTDKPNANAYVLLSQGYYQLKDFNKALQNVETAISMYESDGKVPKEQWYNLARFLYFDKEDFVSALDTLNLLLYYYPSKQYWVQASHLHGELKDEARQLAMMETAYVQGLLDKSNDLVQLSYLYLNAEVPYPAARVMEQGIEAEIVEEKSKNYELAGSAWRQAQETAKSIPMMEKAASLAEEGELYARLGSVYLDGDQHQKAIDSVEKGLKKGGVKRPDQAHMVAGMAHFNMGNYNGARKSFRQAQKVAKDERSEEMAGQWLKYIASEERRQKEIQEGV